jgi:cytochrome c oxidase subunit III
MNDQIQQNLEQDQIEKAKKNLVYVGIFSVVMLFAGLTSAYIVSMGASFWLKASLPSEFWISTLLIVFSSIGIQIAVNAAQKRNKRKLRTGLIATFLLGIGFVYFQYQGYNELFNRGIHVVGNIFVSDGKYGDYFEVKKEGKFIDVNGNDYGVEGEKLSVEEMNSFQSFMSQFLNPEREKNFRPNHYGKKFTLLFKDHELILLNGELHTKDSVPLEYIDRLRLSYLAVNVRDERGDFFANGEMGKDFHVYYQGEEVKYIDRNIYLKGKKLSNYLQIKAMEAADRSSSFLFLITFAHLLHIIVTLFYVFRIVIRSFSVEITNETTMSIKMGAIFWHFLGLLWIYLLLFLLFIH